MNLITDLKDERLNEWGISAYDFGDIGMQRALSDLALMKASLRAALSRDAEKDERIRLKDELIDAAGKEMTDLRSKLNGAIVDCAAWKSCSDAGDDVIGELRAELAASEAQLCVAKEACGFGSPWSVMEVLDRLSAFATMMLRERNYDGDGWEELHVAAQTGPHLSKAILIALSSSSPCPHAEEAKLYKESYEQQLILKEGVSEANDSLRGELTALRAEVERLEGAVERIKSVRGPWAGLSIHTILCELDATKKEGQ
jgi:hypothetical protein